MLTITKIGPESEVVLRNLFAYYLHDMAEWFEIDTGADGSYPYDVPSIWQRHDVYVAKLGDSLAGFALIGWSSEANAHDVGEFFVVRRYRRRGVGQQMATLLWKERPGPWLVRVCEANAPAIPFWRAAIANYSGGVFEEEGRAAGGRPWRFFTFASHSGTEFPRPSAP